MSTLLGVGEESAAEWGTTGACAAGEVDIAGFGGAGQVCTFVTPTDSGTSLSLSGSIGLIGPSLGLSTTVMTSNAQHTEAFDGEFACVGGSIAYGVAAVCGGLNDDGSLNGVYQVFAGSGISIGTNGLFSASFSTGYTWAWVDQPRPPAPPQVNPFGGMSPEMCGECGGTVQWDG